VLAPGVALPGITRIVWLFAHGGPLVHRRFQHWSSSARGVINKVLGPRPLLKQFTFAILAEIGDTKVVIVRSTANDTLWHEITMMAQRSLKSHASE
jgi:hypothetical protein